MSESMPPPSVAQKLLTWYDTCGRALPWRGETITNPYAIWVSEIMLQQTGVRTVIPFYKAFMERFPNVEALANADIDQVLALWQGLGYYRRAHQLHRAAQMIFSDRNGDLPSSSAEWIQLPGIGPYTAASISAITRSERIAAVDGNVLRVVSRYFGIGGKNWKIEAAARAQHIMPHERCSDYTQAIMDFGALICTPKRAFCTSSSCPLAPECHAYTFNTLALFPPPNVSKKIPTRYGTALWIRHAPTGDILLQRSAHTNLLKGLWELPSSPFQDTPPPCPPCTSRSSRLSWNCRGTIRHIFSHFRLELSLWSTDILAHSASPYEGTWVCPSALSSLPFSRLMRKAIAACHSDTAETASPTL